MYTYNGKQIWMYLQIDNSQQVDLSRYNNLYEIDCSKLLDNKLMLVDQILEIRVSRIGNILEQWV